MAACDVALRLQSEHPCLVVRMSFDLYPRPEDYGRGMLLYSRSPLVGGMEVLKDPTMKGWWNHDTVLNSQTGNRLVRTGSLTSTLPSCLFRYRKWPRHASAAVSRAMMDHEMAPRSCASSRMEAISADSTTSCTLGDPNDKPLAEPKG